jgi:hypothetical protein
MISSAFRNSAVYFSSATMPLDVLEVTEVLACVRVSFVALVKKDEPTLKLVSANFTCRPWRNGSLRLCAISTRLDYTRLSTVICKCQTGSKKRCRSVPLFRMHGDTTRGVISLCEFRTVPRVSWSPPIFACIDVRSKCRCCQPFSPPPWELHPSYRSLRLPGRGCISTLYLRVMSIFVISKRRTTRKTAEMPMDVKRLDLAASRETIRKTHPKEDVCQNYLCFTH